MVVGNNTYIYCRVAWGCMRATDPENSGVLSALSFVPLRTSFMSVAVQPSAQSKSMRSNHIGSCVVFCIWTSRKTFSRSTGSSSADGDLGRWTFVLTDKGFVTTNL